MLKHTIVTWDSSFRNFFHLIDSLAQQHYDLSLMELIVVEQRDARTAQRVADAAGVESLQQIAARVRDRLPVSVVYLSEPDHVPYHPGQLLNEGLKRARGEILSAMDADILVPHNFLEVLDRVHAAGNVVTCIHRHTADRPCGVTEQNWTRQIIDYQLVLNCCPDRHVTIPAVVGNKAPLLSARSESWETIDFYDDHRIFSTAYTLFGRDVSLRFKLLLGDVELTLPLAAVHPWHPTEVNRNEELMQILFQSQAALMDWSQKTERFASTARREAAAQLEERYGGRIDEAIQLAQSQMIESTRPQSMPPLKPRRHLVHAPHFLDPAVHYVQPAGGDRVEFHV